MSHTATLPKNRESSPIAFLDRDGTVILEREYLSDPAGVELETAAVEGLQLLVEAGYTLVVVSNQSGIGRGMYTWNDAERVNQRVSELLLPHHVKISAWYMCPHSPSDKCDCRKPLPTLAKRASTDLRLSLENAIMIGDKRSDIEFAHAFDGLGLLVTTGHGQNDRSWADDAKVPVHSNLLEAARNAIRIQSGELTDDHETPQR